MKGIEPGAVAFRADGALRLLNVHPDETRVVVGLFFFSFVLGVARVFTLTASQAIFLEHYAAADLSYVYMLAGLATIGASAGYLYLGHHLSLRRQILANLIFTLVITVVLRASLAGTDARWPAMALAVWFHVLFALTSVAFWGAATQVVDIRQGKRLFSLVTTGEVLAFSIGGFLIIQMVDVIGTDNLLIIGSIGLGAAVFSFLGLSRLNPAPFRAGGRGYEEGRHSPRVSWSSPYLRLIMAYLVISAAVFVFVDNAFNDVAQGRYEDTAELARFFGTFSALVAIVGFFVRTFAAGRMIQRFGLIAGLVVLPATVLVGSSLILSVPVILPALGLLFWLTVMTRLLDQVFRGVQTSSVATLYQPLMERGPAVQTTMDGIIDSGAVGLAGLVLLVLHRFLEIGVPDLALILAVLCSAWIIVTFALRREYVTVVSTVLHRRRISGDNLQIVDHDVLSLVQPELESDHPENVLYAVDLLEEADHPDLADVLSELVHHESEVVRMEILRRIERHAVTGALQGVKDMVEDREASPALRGEALRVIGSLGGEIDPLVMDALQEGAAHLKRGALVGLLRSGSIEGIVYAGAELLEDLQSSSPSDRVLAAHVLRDAAIPSFYRQAIQLLNDPEPLVRAAAVEAAAAMAHPPLWPLVVDALQDPHLAAVASEALISAGPSAVPSLLVGFERHAVDRLFRLSVLRILGLIRGEKVIRIVLPLSGLPNREERHAALVTLVSCGFRPGSEQRDFLRERLRDEAGDSARLLMARESLRGPQEAGVLRAALIEEVERVRHRIFLLLALLYPDREAITTWDNYASGLRKRRAYALEVVENFTTNDEWTWLLPTLEDLSPRDRSRRFGREFGVMPQSFDGQATAIVEDEALSDWTLLCARRLAAVMSIGAVTISEEEERRYERTVRLRSVEIFADLPDHALAGVASRLERVDVEAGEQVFSKGDRGDSMYVIASGRVRIHDGERELAEVGVDHVFGEFTVLHSGPRTASVTATEKTHLLRFTQTDLYDLIAEEVSVARSLIQMIIQRLRENMATRRGAGLPTRGPLL